MTITAIVLARNEAAYIADCLASLASITEAILVIDSGSTDQTIEIAESMGATVVRREWHGYAAQRNSALELCRNADWVLFVDADERVTPTLAREIRDAANSGPTADGYVIPRKNIICGKIMRSKAWWPDYQLRLMRPDRCRYGDEHPVHETAACSGPVLALNSPIIHLNYASWREFARKQFAYARLAASDTARPRGRAYLGAPAREFWRRYVVERGVLDGAHGLSASLLLGLSEIYRVRLARRSGS